MENTELPGHDGNYQLPSFVSESVAEHLPGFQITRAQPLSGGLLNFVWRITIQESDLFKSVIIKWAPSYIASAPTVYLDPSRILIEAKAMNLFESGGSMAAVAASGIRPPHIYTVDSDRQLIIMEDLGTWPNLSEWLWKHHSSHEVCQAGHVLGQFIGDVHRLSFCQASYASEFDNISVQKTRLEFQYSQIEKYARDARLSDAAELGHIAMNLGTGLLQPGRCLIMGDLWPASIIVTDQGLRIFDWELAHFGRPFQDVGHLCAHLWMHQHRAPDEIVALAFRSFMACFLTSYQSAIQTSQTDIWDANELENCAVHFGCEILSRTVGAFRGEYLYSDLAIEHPIVTEAAQFAAVHLRTPSGINTFDQLKAEKY
ncbi:MAG: phosphotransferase [Bacillota bacterium]|nr:phosphotransferase [Bacillota bacterium]